MRQVEGMSVLVTGGGSGIGEGIARHLCSKGALVTISGRRADKVQAVAASIGPACRAVVGDVTVDADRRAMVAAAVEHGGGLDVLVNNAGNMYRGPLAELDESKLLDLFHSNVVGGIMLTQVALEPLRDSRGAVVFFGSARVVPENPVYRAAADIAEGLSRWTVARHSIRDRYKI